MANYYTLGAALPTLKQGEYRSSTITSEEFLLLLKEQLTRRDAQLIRLLLLRYDNELLLHLLRSDEVPEWMQKEDAPHLTIGEAKLREMIELVEQYVRAVEDPFTVLPPKRPKLSKKLYPEYMTHFVELYLTDHIRGEVRSYFYEDILAMEYAAYVQQEGNAFMREWFRFEENISALLAAYTAERYKLELGEYLIGERDLLQQLREHNWLDIQVGPYADLVKEVKGIAEEEHLALREQKIDALKWAELDKVTFSDLFSIDAMIAYFLRLQILERWERLDKVRGEETFRQIISGLNNEGADELEHFREAVRMMRHAKREKVR